MIAGAGCIAPRWETLMCRLLVDAGLEALGFPYVMPAEGEGVSRRASWLAKRLMACRWSGLLADRDIKRPWSADMLERVSKATGGVKGLAPAYTDALLGMTRLSMKDAFPCDEEVQLRSYFSAGPNVSGCVSGLSCVALQAGAVFFSLHGLI